MSLPSSFRTRLGGAVIVIALVVALTGCVAAPASPWVEADPPAAVGAETGPLGVDDGVVPEGEWVRLDDDIPAMTQLDPALREALEAAQTSAVDEGADPFLFVDGWRSTRYQQQLFDQAVQRYGSEQEAARWVKRGDASKHVTGEAVDLATADAMDWLNRFGGPFGLCQVYSNEAWHFELAADDEGVCPAQLSDGSAG